MPKAPFPAGYIPDLDALLIQLAQSDPRLWGDLTDYQLDRRGLVTAFVRKWSRALQVYETLEASK